VPEGDTIYRAAAALRVALVGKPLKSFAAERLLGPRPRAGSIMETVESRGKHLEMTWDDGTVLHTHMRMTGTWHLYRPGEVWRRPIGQARVTIDVGEWLAVCFSAPVVETWQLADRRRHPGMGSLGPDLCREDADLHSCVERMGRLCHADTPMHEVMLDQRVVCGVGNVYKSEALFACGVSPFAPLGNVSDEVRLDLVTTSSRMLRANLGSAQRMTTSATPERLAVYGRTGKPCPVCAAPIRWGRFGEHARSTYWCERCQSIGDRRAAPREHVEGSRATTAGRGAPPASRTAARSTSRRSRTP
jgi:endonuclease VIII